MVPFRLSAREISGFLELIGSFVWSWSNETLSFLTDPAELSVGVMEACCSDDLFFAIGLVGGVDNSFLLIFGAAFIEGVEGGSACFRFLTGAGAGFSVTESTLACNFFGALEEGTGSGLVGFAGNETFAEAGGIFLAGFVAVKAIFFFCFDITFWVQVLLSLFCFSLILI